MDEEPADELARLERHGLVAAGPLDPVVLAPERDAGLVGGDETAVGDCDPVGVARQIPISSRHRHAPSALPRERFRSLALSGPQNSVAECPLLGNSGHCCLGRSRPIYEYTAPSVELGGAPAEIYVLVKIKGALRLLAAHTHVRLGQKRGSGMSGPRLLYPDSDRKADMPGYPKRANTGHSCPVGMPLD